MTSGSSSGLAVSREPARKPLEPGELARVERRPDDAPVRRVDADDPDAAADSRDHACLVERVEVVLADAADDPALRVAHGPSPKFVTRPLDASPCRVAIATPFQRPSP